MPEFFTRTERQQLAANGEAMPDGRYPIRNQADIENAYKDWTRTGRNPQVAAWIGKRAKALGVPNPANQSYDQIIAAHAARLPKR